MSKDIAQRERTVDPTRDLESLRAELAKEQDPAERARIETTLSILGPVIKHKGILGLTPEQMDLISSVATRAGELEKQELKAELEKGTVYLLDKRLISIAERDVDPSWAAKLAQGSASIREEIVRRKSMAQDYTDRDKFKDTASKTPRDVYESWFRPDPEKKQFDYPLAINYFVPDAGRQLAQVALQEIGALSEGESLEMLRSKVPSERDFYQNPRLNDYRNLPTNLPNITAEVFHRVNSNTYDISLSITGDTAYEIITSPVPPDPFESSNS